MPTYPTAVKIFPTFVDYTDIIFANSINELHSEIISVESVLGTWSDGQVIDGTQYTSFSIAINDLFLNKAPINHQHSHHNLGDLVTNSTTGAVQDDHAQYIRCDGHRPFTGPVGGVWAQRGDQLVPLSQLQSFGYINVDQAIFLIDLALGNLVVGAWGGPPTYVAPTGNAPLAPTWRLIGGVTSGVTGGGAQSGWLYTSFNNAFQHQVQGFVATKMPVGAGHPAPPYNYIEAQLTLMYIDQWGCWCAFSHDYSFQPGLWAQFSWVAVGY